MSKSLRTFLVGQAKISIINIGNIYLPLAKYMNIPETDLATRDDLRDVATQTIIPIHIIHIQLPETSLLVDAGIYDVETEPEYAIPNYSPPPSLVSCLNELGISLADIEHVIITHRHWDHFNGTTYEYDGEYRPQFPNARYYLGKADWERAQTAFQDSQSIESCTLQVLDQYHVLEQVDSPRTLGQSITIIPAPGETAGHQIVRIHSEGETLYCLGDLYHHPVEFANPEWKVSWAKAETIRDSRHALTQQAVSENALLVATHIPDVGRLVATDSGVAWTSVL